jgi:hypothetical protein
MGEARRVLTCWAVALGLVAALCWYLLLPPEHGVRLELGAAPVAVIGTSLSRHAFSPDSRGGPGLLGDGRAHSRSAVMNGAPEELEVLLEMAIEDGAQLVILEVRPFLFRLKYERLLPPCADAWCAAKRTLTPIRRHVRGHVNELLGRDNDTLAGRLRLGRGDTNMDRPYDAYKPLSARFPLELRGDQPSARLQRLVARAQAAGTDIILFLPPALADCHPRAGARAGPAGRPPCGSHGGAAGPAAVFTSDRLGGQRLWRPWPSGLARAGEAGSAAACLVGGAAVSETVTLILLLAMAGAAASWLLPAKLAPDAMAAFTLMVLAALSPETALWLVAATLLAFGCFRAGDRFGSRGWLVGGLTAGLVASLFGRRFRKAICGLASALRRCGWLHVAADWWMGRLAAPGAAGAAALPAVPAGGDGGAGATAAELPAADRAAAV